MRLFKGLLAFSILAAGSAAFGAKCETTVTAMPGMKFDTKEIVIPTACTNTFSIKLVNTETIPKAAMGHNLVVVKTDKMAALTSAAIPAGLAGNYLPKDKSIYVAATKVLGPKETETITLDATKLKAIAAAPHSFVCTFPGHFAIMKGQIKYKMAKKS